jgi:GDPmannose 4,6-dehydratase
MPSALITGVTGQDGSYLAELLLTKGYTVHGLKRRASSFNTDRVDHIYEDFHESGTRFLLHYADLTDGGSLATLLHDLRPDEVCNLATQSHKRGKSPAPAGYSNV